MKGALTPLAWRPAATPACNGVKNDDVDGVHSYGDVMVAEISLKGHFLFGHLVEIVVGSVHTAEPNVHGCLYTRGHSHVAVMIVRI